MIWKKYLYKEVLKTLILFLLCFYLLYTLLDYSIHAQHFSKISNFSITVFFTYYLCQLIKRLEMMLPLAFLISLIKVLLQLNTRNELIALLSSGLKTSKFLAPLFTIAFGLTALLFFNFEYFVPYSLEYLEGFENKHFKKKSFEDMKTPSAYSLPIQGEGTLLFGVYEQDVSTFRNVYLVLSENLIYKMKTLFLKNGTYTGEFVETFKRDENNQIVKTSETKSISFNDLKIDFSLRKQSETPFEHLSISRLFKLTKTFQPKENKQTPKVLTHLYFKLLTPFTPLLVLIAVAPFCLQSSRRVPAFYIYAISLFSFIAFFIILDACVILGEYNKITPSIAILLPFLSAFLGWGCHFYQCTCK